MLRISLVVAALLVACGGDDSKSGAGTGGTGGSDGGSVCPSPVVPPNGMGSCAGGGNHVSFPPAGIDCQKACGNYKTLCASGCSISPFDFCDEAGCLADCEAGKTGFGFGNALAGCSAGTGECSCLKDCLNAACGDLPPI